jgi:hypothetical protein
MGSEWERGWFCFVMLAPDASVFVWSGFGHGLFIFVFLLLSVFLLRYCALYI